MRFDEVSRARVVWSGAAETALADAYRFAGHSIPYTGALKASDVFIFRDSSIAPLLDMRSRFRFFFVNVLDSKIRKGASQARSDVLAVQCDKILIVAALYPVTLEGFQAVRSSSCWCCSPWDQRFHPRVVVHRIDEAGSRNWLRGGSPLGLTWSHLLLLQWKPRLTPGGSGVLADPARIHEEFCNAWPP